MSKALSKVNKILLILIAAFAILLNIYSLRAEYGNKVMIYRPGTSNRTMYMEEFMDDGMYPDALLRALVRKKKVEVWSDFIPYVNYPSHGHDHSDDPDIPVFFSYDYYSDNNYGLFFGKYAGEKVVNKALPSPDEVSASDIGDHLGSFVFTGYTTDLLRNIYSLNEDREYVNTYFHYAHCYYNLDEDRMKNNYHLYMADERIEDADTLVAIWDSRENLYLMSRDFYEDNIAFLFADK